MFLNVPDKLHFMVKHHIYSSVNKEVAGDFDGSGVVLSTLTQLRPLNTWRSALRQFKEILCKLKQRSICGYTAYTSLGGCKGLATLTL